MRRSNGGLTAHWREGVGLALSLTVLALACGTERPPPEGNAAAQPAKGSSGSAFGDRGGTKPPGCGITPGGTSGGVQPPGEGSQCECIDVPLFVDPPTLYFVLDRSGSMQVADKWNQVRVAIGRIMRGLGPRANFGAAMFPGAMSVGCNAGDEIMAVRPGDAPSSGADGPTTTALLTATRVNPGGGTPTGPTLEGVRSRLASNPGSTFVILATDGAPNCNPRATCGYDECQANIEEIQGCPKEGPRNCCEPPIGQPEDCNDSGGTLAAIASLKAAGIPVYVLGLPGGEAYATLLDAMAVAGGTALPSSPKYFAVNAASGDVMLAALKRIAAQIAGTCTFDLKDSANASLVNVYVDDVVLPFEPVNGWTIEGNKVTLVGAACDRVKSGDALAVRIIAGCPRVEPR